MVLYPTGYILIIYPIRAIIKKQRVKSEAKGQVWTIDIVNKYVNEYVNCPDLTLYFGLMNGFSFDLNSLTQHLAFPLKKKFPVHAWMSARTLALDSLSIRNYANF